MSRTPDEMLKALEFSESLDAQMRKRDPQGQWGSARDFGMFAFPGSKVDMTPMWIPGPDKWQRQSLKVQQDQFEQEKQYRADEAEKNSAHSGGIISRPIIRRS